MQTISQLFRIWKSLFCFSVCFTFVLDAAAYTPDAQEQLTIEGYVFDKYKKPATNVNVSLHGPDGFLASTITDEDGEYSFTRDIIGEKHYSIRAWVSDRLYHPRYIEISSRLDFDRAHTFEEIDSGIITGALTADDFLETGYVRFYIYKLGETSLYDSVSLTMADPFRMVLPVGQYRLAAEDNATVYRYEDIVVSVESYTELYLDMRPIDGLTISGKVLRPHSDEDDADVIRVSLLNKLDARDVRVQHFQGTSIAFAFASLSSSIYSLDISMGRSRVIRTMDLLDGKNQTNIVISLSDTPGINSGALLFRAHHSRQVSDLEGTITLIDATTETPIRTRYDIATNTTYSFGGLEYGELGIIYRAGSVFWFTNVTLSADSPTLVVDAYLDMD